MTRRQLRRWALAGLVSSTLVAAGPVRVGAQDGWEGQLSEAQRQALDRHGYFIRTSETFKEVFCAYSQTGRPIFITCDSVFAGVHRLFEDYLAYAQGRRAKGLDRALVAAWKRLRRTRPPRGVRGPWVRARGIVGVGLALLGGATPEEVEARWRSAGDELRRWIAGELRRIRGGAGFGYPDWLQKPRPPFVGMDYASIREVAEAGFVPPVADSASWTHVIGAEDLSGYRAAVRWYQGITLSALEEDDLATALILRWALGEEGQSELRRMAGFLKRVLGPPREGVWVIELPEVAPSAIAAAAREPQRVWQEVRKRTRYRASGFPRLILLPQWRLVDTAAFARALGGDEGDGWIRSPSRWPPTGLWLAYGFGSPWAKGLVREEPELVRRLEDFRGTVRRSARGAEAVGGTGELPLYEYWLAAVAAAAGPAEPDAPAFMRRPAWQAKDCQTALSGWVLFRHAVQAWTPVLILIGLPPRPEGFVEPKPQVFAHLAAFCLAASRVFAGVVDRSEDSPAMVEAWLRAARLCLRLERMAHKQLRQVAFNDIERKLIRQYARRLARLMGYMHPDESCARDLAAQAVRTVTLVCETGPARGAFYMAVGRPTAIYVAYPWKGRRVVCRGAILPYYEFVHRGILTDRAWRRLLDGKDPPKPPAWLSVVRR